MFMLFIEIFFNDSFLLYNKILLCKKCMQNYVLKLLSFCCVIVVELTNINMVYMEIKEQKGRMGCRLEVKYKYENYVGTMTD